jgi:hypothetical protein
MSFISEAYEKYYEGIKNEKAVVEMVKQETFKGQVPVFEEAPPAQQQQVSQPNMFY